MPKDYPDHHDAELVLRFYELRREEVMRASRTAMNQWFPKTFDDLVAVTKPDHPVQTAFRQVVGYWEMVYGMARNGVIHPEFLMENSGEGIFMYARFEPHLAAWRAQFNPRGFINCEWVTTNTDLGRELLKFNRDRYQKMLSAK